MSKLVVTAMNGIGGIKGATRPTDEPVEYLTHVLDLYLPSVGPDGARRNPRECMVPADIPFVGPFYGKGGMFRRPERRIYDQLRGVLQTRDVWLAFGFSYGVRDTVTRLIEPYWEDHPPADVYLMLATFDGDFAGRVAQAALPWGKKLRERIVPGPLVHYHANRFQRASFPGGMDFAPNIILDSRVPRAANRGDSIELTQGQPIRSPQGAIVGYEPIRHGTFDTLPAVADVIRTTIRLACTEVRRRNSKSGGAA